jgi:hypothetical protein
LAAFTLFAATRSFAQQPASPQIDSNLGVESWTGGTIDDALFQSLSGTTIPMTHYTVNSTKSGNTVAYKGVLVGGNPFAANPNPVTIHAVLIPLILLIAQPDGSVVTFDPSVPDPCDSGNVSPVYRFQNSPLVVASNLTFNGVSVGKAQYIDGFMRAEFWNKTGGSPSYSNPISWTFHSAVLATLLPIPATLAIVQNQGTCSERGVVLQSEFSSFMKRLIIPILQSSGVI